MGRPSLKKVEATRTPQEAFRYAYGTLESIFAGLDREVAQLHEAFAPTGRHQMTVEAHNELGMALAELDVVPSLTEYNDAKVTFATDNRRHIPRRVRLRNAITALEAVVNYLQEKDVPQDRYDYLIECSTQRAIEDVVRQLKTIVFPRTGR